MYDNHFINNNNVRVNLRIFIIFKKGGPSPSLCAPPRIASFGDAHLSSSLLSNSFIWMGLLSHKMEDNNNNNSEFYDREMSEEIVPTVKGMLLSIDYIATVIRTTLCDIMCTTSTDMEYVEDVTSPHRKKFAKSHNVALPYRKTSSFEEMFDAVTPLQQIKVIEAKVKRNKILQDEKEEFMRKTRSDRQEKQDREKLAATKIQAIFRGYWKRPRDPSKRRPPRGPEILSQQELRDFLTELQFRLNLKPIKGLTLTGKDSKNTKINHQLRMAGAFALQRFFHLIVARNRAQQRMSRVRLVKSVHQKWLLHRFFRDTLRRMANWKKEVARRDAAAIVIQNKIRAFQACRKARLKRRQRTRNRRELEAATIIQRAFRGRLSVFYFPDFASLLSKVEEAVIEAEINALMFKVGAEYHAELSRQADMEMMLLEDLRSRKATEYAEWLRQQELERLRQLDKDRLAREAAEAEERRRLLEEQQRLLELESMQEEDFRMRRIMEEERRVRELALMRAEDDESGDYHIDHSLLFSRNAYGFFLSDPPSSTFCELLPIWINPLNPTYSLHLYSTFT